LEIAAFHWPDAGIAPLGALSPATSKALVLAWAFALGSAVGSFLNVVVYRLPAGLSIVHPGSRCPVCKHPIRWYDNVPVFSWIVLRGRCRDCRTRISPRYPAVEAATAALFVVLVLVEGLSEGANLPGRFVPLSDGPVFLSTASGRLACLVAFHLLLCCTLLCAVLIQFDGHRLATSLLMPALVVGVAAPLALPEIRPVPAGIPWDGWVGAMVDGAAGLAAGLVLALISWPVTGPKWNSGFALALGAVGLFLGWQAALGLGLAATLIHIPVRILSRLWPSLDRLPPTAWLAAGTVAWILSWRPIVRLCPVLG
jgi:leader peptidase (prepilin peptidase)/N-methyltransferase